MNKAFSMLDIRTRPAKPRTVGMTMMVDWGIPLGEQRDLLALAADFFDLAKIAVGISGLLPEDVLTRKITTYREAGIEPFPGGQFLELAHHQGQAGDYYEECRRVGYRLIEVSDNVVHFSEQERERLIREAIDEHGLKVLGEVGSKHVETALETLVADIEIARSAGAWKVLVEAAEFASDQGFNTSLVEGLLAQVGPSDIMFELPGKWIPDVHDHQVYQMMVWLVENVGADVNLANVLPRDVVPLETLRTDVGVTWHP